MNGVKEKVPLFPFIFGILSYRSSFESTCYDFFLNNFASIKIRELLILPETNNQIQYFQLFFFH